MRGRDQKRSFVKQRSSNKSRYRLSEGEDPLSSADESRLIKQSSSTSLNLPRFRYDISSSEVKNTEILRAWHDRTPTNSKASKELSIQSQRMRNALSPDPYRVEKTVSPDLLHRVKHNSDQWDCGVASSQSESSVDILSGSCDSLDNVTMGIPTVKKSASPPIRRGESSTVKVSAVDKKQVIRNLATITSLPQVVEGEHNKDDKIENRCSPCGPDAQIICSHDSSDVLPHDLNGASHDPTGVSHNPTSVSHEVEATDDFSNQSASMDSNISSQSAHVDFFDSPAQQHSLHDIREEQNEVLNKKVQHMSIQSTPSMLSIGKWLYIINYMKGVIIMTIYGYTSI